MTEQVLGAVQPGSLELAREILSLPEQIRGYEGIKEESIEKVKQAAEEKLGRLRGVKVGAPV